jgi:hypothetical protein
VEESVLDLPYTTVRHLLDASPTDLAGQEASLTHRVARLENTPETWGVYPEDPEDHRRTLVVIRALRDPATHATTRQRLEASASQVTRLTTAAPTPEMRSLADPKTVTVTLLELLADTDREGTRHGALRVAQISGLVQEDALGFLRTIAHRRA